MVTNGKTNAVTHEQSGLRLAGLALGLRGPGQSRPESGMWPFAAPPQDPHLEDLVAVADTLSLLAPEADPPSVEREAGSGRR